MFQILNYAFSIVKFVIPAGKEPSSQLQQWLDEVVSASVAYSLLENTTKNIVTFNFKP
jgi:hypothetical protein